VGCYSVMVLISFYPVVRDRRRQPEPQALLHMDLLLLGHSAEQSNEQLRHLPAEDTRIPDEVGRQASRNEVSVEQEENSAQEASSTTTQRHLPVQAQADEEPSNEQVRPIFSHNLISR
jgi:hypothetical protein